MTVFFLAQNKEKRPANQAGFWNDRRVHWQPSGTETLRPFCFCTVSTAARLKAQPPGAHGPLGCCWKGTAVLGGFKAISLAVPMHVSPSNLFTRKAAHPRVHACQTFIGRAFGCPACLSLPNVHSHCLKLSGSYAFVYRDILHGFQTFQCLNKQVMHFTFICQKTNVLWTFMFQFIVPWLLLFSGKKTTFYI